MTRELIKWVAESDPIINEGGEQWLPTCYYCKADAPQRGFTKLDWHAPGCWYVRCREQVRGRIVGDKDIEEIDEERQEGLE